MDKRGGKRKNKKKYLPQKRKQHSGKEKRASELLSGNVI